MLAILVEFLREGLYSYSYLMLHNIATIMAQITSPHPATSNKASGDDYGIPDLAGDLNSNPRAWLKNAEAALKSFLVP